MSLGDFLIVSAFALAVFWIVGKIFIKAMKFILIALVGVAVVGAVVLSPLFLLYLVAALAWWLYKRANAPASGSASVEFEPPTAGDL